MQTLWRRTGKQVLDWVYPPESGFSTNAKDPWANVQFLDDPCCAQCGFPFEYDLGEMVLCARCSAKPPKTDKIRAALRYDDASRSRILRFKHGGRREYLSVFTTHMHRAGREIWPASDAIIPVPLHPTRLIKRRFNQAAILAQSLSKRTGLPVNTNILMRHRKTESQGLQTSKGRFRNVRGAFSVPETMRDDVKGLNFVIIDDVYTTGATLDACTAALKHAGAAHIYAVTLARVVRGQAITA